MARRLAITGTALLLAICIAAWITSMFLVIWRNPVPPDLTLALWRGEVSLSNMGAYAGPGWTVYGFDGWRQRWWPPGTDQGFLFHEHEPGQYRWWRVAVPLWMPAALAAVALTALCACGARARTRLRQGRCRACGYALAGLPAGAPCPECGAAPQAAMP